MIGCHPGNLEVALRTVVHNELGQNRSPTNMHLLAMLMHARPDAAPKVGILVWCCYFICCIDYYWGQFLMRDMMFRNRVDLLRL